MGAITLCEAAELSVGRWWAIGRQRRMKADLYCLERATASAGYLALFHAPHFEV
jgi:hypothetical protein